MLCCCCDYMIPFWKRELSLRCNTYSNIHLHNPIYIYLQADAKKAEENAAKAAAKDKVRH